MYTKAIIQFTLVWTVGASQYQCDNTRWKEVDICAIAGKEAVTACEEDKESGRCNSTQSLNIFWNFICYLFKQSKDRHSWEKAGECDNV